MQPYEIIAGPLKLWLGPTGTAFPLINAAPAAGWTSVGTNNDRNQSADGVTVTHSETLQQVKPGGATGPVKVFREDESLTFKVVMWDMTLEQYTAAINGNPVSTTAAGTGTPGTKKIGLSKGKIVKEYALLVRGPSAYDEAYAAQYEVPRCYQSGNAEIVYRKGTPAGISLEFTTLEDLATNIDAERFGRLIMQHQAALP